MSMAEYLAKNYLTADAPAEKKSKKRKRKGTAAAASGLVIADDDISGWNAASAVDDDGDTPMTISGTSSEFRKSKKNNWTAVGAPAPSSADQAAADAILASAAAERESAQAAADSADAPQVVDADTDSPTAVMESGARAGLQTADQVAAQVAAKRTSDRAAAAAATAAAGATAQETIYRDASGRIINVAMKRAEARRAAEREERRLRDEAEAAKGDVQRALREQQKRELQDAKYMTLARGADDTEMNEELKARERWNDPAAGFLKKKKAGRSVTGKPLYKGAAEPNRYGIRPGHRWDGVDRGNGFEREWFKSRNRREDVARLEYAWQMDE